MPEAQKYAKRQVTRDPATGRPSLQYVDTQTGQILNNLQGYQIIESKGYLSQKDLGIDPLSSETASYANTDGTHNQSGANVAANIKSNAVNIANGSGAGLGVGPESADTNPSNNFGFVGPNVSKGFGIASMVPGPIGFMGKMGNTAVGAANAAAVAEARRSIGLESKGPATAAVGGALGGFFGRGFGKGPNTGQVAEVTGTTGKVSPVGFQALDPTTGRTNLTPTEARSRVARGLAVEATPAQVTAAKQSFAEEFGSKGLFSGLMDTITGFFGQPASTSYPEAPSSSSSTGSFDYSDYSFSSSDNTSKSANTGMSVADQYGSYGQGRASGFGNSAQAAAAASGETQGLY